MDEMVTTLMTPSVVCVSADLRSPIPTTEIERMGLRDKETREAATLCYCRFHVFPGDAAAVAQWLELPIGDCNQGGQRLFDDGCRWSISFCSCSSWLNRFTTAAAR
ncbi:hypothetical protein L1887_14323 [Cichorium endivia]|nr:hypothetical protein L1887_14323 [Cichorium endivia]